MKIQPPERVTWEEDVLRHIVAGGLCRSDAQSLIETKRGSALLESLYQARIEASQAARQILVVDQLQYADVPPKGYRLVSHDHVITQGDMVCRNLMDKDGGGWESPRTGQNIIGATVRELWPSIMSAAIRSR